MNILIIQKSMGIGGVNVVSATLARKFQEEGHKVTVFAFYKGDNDMPRESYGNAFIIVGFGFKVCKDNVRTIRYIIEEYQIDLIINQWGLSYVPAVVLKKACKGSTVKWISYYHSDPLFNGKTHDVEIALEHDSTPFKRIFDKVRLSVMRKVTGKMMRYNYKVCWRYMVLADSYVSHFKQFTGLTDVEKLRVMNNPITIDTQGFEFNVNNKLKELIFVGRLDPSSKRVSRLVEAWSMVEPKFSDWKLTIVGDGPERGQITSIITRNRLKNVELVGQQNPRPYYERASLLGMTSDFEGWPLVLGECMSFGVVPVVYDAVNAIYDIIEDGESGLIVHKVDGGFSVDEMARVLMKIMLDEHLRYEMMRKALVKSNDFRINSIYKHWNSIFEELENERKNNIS